MDGTIVQESPLPTSSVGLAEAEPIASVTPAVPPAPEPPIGVPFLFTADQFSRLVEADVFPDECRVELWDGMIFEKMAKKRPHSVAANKFIAALSPLIPRGWHLAVEDSATVGPGRVPLPDLMIVRGAPDDFRGRNPTAGEIALLIELADSSLRFDTGEKLAGYARAGVAHYWVANLVEGVIQTYSEPVPPGARYAHADVFARGQSIPFLLDGRDLGVLAVDDLLPLPEA